MRSRVALAVLALAATGCTVTSEDTETIRERQERAYQACLEAGGSFATDRTDWSCTLPTKEDDR